MFSSHVIIATLFPRLLGIIYFFSLGAFLFQVRGLFGKDGILPVSLYLKFFKNRLGKRRYYWIPSVFWWDASDQTLMGVVGLGTFCAILLVLGFSPVFLLPLLILIHLSIVSVGQDFLSFGWEMFFLEICYNAFFLSLTSTPNMFIWISLNLLIMRFHWQAGASKLQSRDPTWRSLTALNYHYETQPLPSTLAWYFHRLPSWFHRCSALMMFAVELILPFGVLGTESIRLLAFFGFFFLQFFIWISGNYSYLNHLTAILVSLLLSDTYLRPFFEMSTSPAPSPFLLNLVVSGVGVVLITFQLMQLWQHFFKHPRIARLLNAIYPFHLANRYGIFAVMTTTRYEIIIEGSDDKKVWKEYLFRYKPSEVERRPRRISPYQPRLDWQAWFLPFTHFETETWFQQFLRRLLEGAPHVISLLRYNPFPEKPPIYIRAKMYVYKLSDPITKKRLGHWWVREYLKPYSPVLTLAKEGRIIKTVVV